MAGADLPVFLWGPFADPLMVLALGAGREAGVPAPCRALLSGHAPVWAAGRAELRPAPDTVLEGVLAPPACSPDLAFLAAVFGHELWPATVRLGPDEPCAALVLAPPATPQPGAPFEALRWARRHAGVSAQLIADLLTIHRASPPAALAARLGRLHARAGAALRARGPEPTTLRRATTPGDVVLRARREPYAAFFSVEEYELTHRRHAGGMSAPLTRAAFLSGDAATVLPYDPARDVVLLIEQFRVGPFARGARECWSLEAIAGIVDGGESPEETARREAREEAGLALGALHRVSGYYPSPGAKAEFIYSFVATADLPDEAAQGGGLACEGEDIRAHIVPFARAMALCESGEIGNAPLLLSLMWLERNRARLRQGA